MLINCLAQIDQLWPNHLENLIQLKINVKLTSVILYNQAIGNCKDVKEDTNMSWGGKTDEFLR